MSEDDGGEVPEAPAGLPDEASADLPDEAPAGLPDEAPAGLPDEASADPSEDLPGGSPYQRPPGLAGVTRFRSVALVGVSVGVIFVVALVFVLIASGGNPDSVPGTDPVASLAALPSGFLVGTTGGLAASPDGKTWSVAHLPSELVAVASSSSTAYVLTGGELRSTTDLRAFTNIAAVKGTVIGAGQDGSVDVLDGTTITHLAPDGTRSVLPAGRSQPSGILALALSPANPQTIFLGGPVSGLWRTQDGGATWQLLDRIPVQALLVDPANPQELFVGTVGGVFVSTDGGQAWAPTSLRNDVNGLSASGGRIYAVGSDRLIYVSTDGVNGWSQVSAS